MPPQARIEKRNTSKTTPPPPSTTLRRCSKKHQNVRNISFLVLSLLLLSLQLRLGFISLRFDSLRSFCCWKQQGSRQERQEASVSCRLGFRRVGVPSRPVSETVVLRSLIFLRSLITVCGSSKSNGSSSISSGSSQSNINPVPTPLSIRTTLLPPKPQS